MNAIEYANQVKDLFAVPVTAMRIKDLINSDSADARSIASVISADPGLASHLMRLANSAIYGFPRKVDNIQKAIQVVGTTSIYDYALVFGISKSYSNIQNDLIDLDKFWEQSVTCSILAKHFARLLGSKDAERLFISGLLHNVGEMVVMQVNSDVITKCNSFRYDKTPKEAQFDALGFTFAEVSAALSRSWMLPDTVVSAIAMQHHEDSFADQLDMQVMQLAYELSLINTYPKYFNCRQHLPEFLYEGLNLDLDDIDTALDFANFKTEQILHLFNPDVFKAA